MVAQTNENGRKTARRRFKSLMTGCRCNYDGLKLIRFGALNGRAWSERQSTSRGSGRPRFSSTVSVVINGDNYNESADYSDYPEARAFSLSRPITDEMR